MILGYLLGRPTDDSFGGNSMHDLGMESNIKVRSFVVDGKWSFPTAKTSQLGRQFPSDIPILLIQSAEFKDEIVWKKSNQGVLTMSSALPTNFPANQQVKWCKMIWFKGNIKKHSVCVLGWPSKMPPKQKQKKFIGLGSLFLTLLMFSVTEVHKDCMHVLTSCTFNRFICDEISKFGVT